MVPRTFRYHGLRYTTSYVTPANAKYLRKDFNDMMKKVTVMQLLIDHGVPMLRGLFEDYKNRLISQNQNMEWFADKANDWANRVFSQCSTEMDLALVTVTAKCKKRLKDIGHNIVDINYVQYAISQSLRGAQIYKLAYRTFRKIRPKLEALVTSQKIIRIKNERRQLLKTRYRQYQQALIPDAWQYQPPENFFREAGAFSNFLNAEYVTRGDISRELTDSLFPGLVEEWTKKRKLEILSLLPEVDTEQPFEKQIQKLDLATSVITCNDCKYMNQEGRVLLGWKNICRHARRTVGGNLNPCSGSEVVEPVAVVAATSLICCAGLDPRTTTIQDMDSRDDRFFCGNCIPDTSNGVTGLKAYKWTECVRFSMYYFGLPTDVTTS
ncbi:hypothetical protein JR316_0003602 [Psilocybe cubensis]|uniref:Uncharacterized protein n=1 Tax=Psilocybe cubensis TaxID=181762 RepID=A0ACB8H900_PSICU|nr:hypothetical protein JR316_0003602 [Psilocybe cubensis]KAH9484122.1 hypothetical protein JR316_0003602 [Psilocybe cubensis]